MRSDRYRTLISRVLDEESEDRRGNVTYSTCPFCGADKGHFSINFDKNVAHCYRCDYGTRNISRLMLKLGLSIGEVPKSVAELGEGEKNLKSVISSLSPAQSAAETVEALDYSTDLGLMTAWFRTTTAPLSEKAREYLHKRGLTDKEILSYGIREGTDKYRGRVLVPSTWGKNISYAIARDYTGTLDPKVLNPPSNICLSSEDVWNLGRAKMMADKSHLIVCEGSFSAIAAARYYPAVATYGKSIAERSNSDLVVKSQGDKILEAGFNEIIMLYDADATASQKQSCEYLFNRGANVSYCYLPAIDGNTHADAEDFWKKGLLEDILSKRRSYSPARYDLDMIAKNYTI